MRLALFAGISRVGHAGRMLDQCFCIAKADRASDHPQPVHHRDACRISTFQLKRDHAAKAGHLLLGQGVLREARQTWIVDGFNAGMGLKRFCHTLGTRGMAFDAQL